MNELVLLDSATGEVQQFSANVTTTALSQHRMARDGAGGGVCIDCDFTITADEL